MAETAAAYRRSRKAPLLVYVVVITDSSLEILQLMCRGNQPIPSRIEIIEDA